MSDENHEIQSRLNVTAFPFSQVVAISQKALNDALLFLFQRHQAFRTISVQYPGIGNLEAEMSAPNIVLPVNEEGTYETVVFLCNFKSGNLKFKRDDGYSEPIQIKGWRFAFDVNLGQLAVPKGEEYDDVTKVLAHPGDYSIKRLYLNFATNKIVYFREDMSDFRGHTWEGVDKSFFTILMTRWTAQPSSPGANPKFTTLGYGLEFDDPSKSNPPAPSFPPTAVRHQVYKHIAPDRSKPEQGLHTGEKNTLLFVEMTEKNPFPQDTPLSYSGNFLSGDMRATACISRKLLFDSYLLRNIPSEQGSITPGLLQIINRELYFWLGNLKMYYDPREKDWRLRFDFRIGPPDPKRGYDPEEGYDCPDYFSWNRISPLRWEFKKKFDPKDTFQNDRYPSAIGDAITTNYITINPGNNSITLSGTSYMYLAFSISSSRAFKGGVIMEWSMDLTVGSIRQGGLELNLNIPDDPKKWVKTTYIDDPKTWIEHTSNNISFTQNERWKDINSVKEAVDDALSKMDFNQLRKDLKAALGKISQYVLSGSQTFLYSNPIFSKHGDLLVEAVYDEGNNKS